MTPGLISGLVVGVGGRAEAAPDALIDLVAAALAARGRTLDDVATVATLDRRADHPGVTLLTRLTGGRLVAFDADTLSAQEVDHRSDRVARHVGTPSVAEAATRAAGGLPSGPRHSEAGWTLVVGDLHDLRHHGDREVAPGLLDLAVNVHAQRPPDFLAARLTDTIAGLAAYPDPTRATQAVARAHGVPESSVLLTHGAAEAFTLVAQQAWRHPCVVHPQFTEPEAALAAHGHTVDRLLLGAADGFRLGGARPAPGADLVMVGNPTNPTSRLHDPEDIAALGTDSHGGERLVVVDEAFLDVVEDAEEPAYSLVRRAATDCGLAVIRSLTKTYSIAGLRIGYVVAHPDVIGRLAGRRTPWPVGTLALAAAEACVSDEGRAYAAALRAELPGRLRHLSAGLTARGFEVVAEPRGPFVLAQREDATGLRGRLRERGIAVRRGDTFPGLDGRWLRIAARSAEVTDRLLGALDDLAGHTSDDPAGRTSDERQAQRTPHE